MAGTQSGPFDPEGLSTVHEVPNHKTSHDTEHAFEQHSLYIGRPPGSRDPSINGSFARSHHENDMAAEPPRVPYTTGPRKGQHTRTLSDGKLKKADRRNTVGTQLSGTTFAQKPRRGGLRNTIRRMFGRKSHKDRISMPSGTVYRSHDPEEFITSAANIEAPNKKMERSASLPTNAFVRSSGLSSHPPFQPPAIPVQSEAPAPPPLQRDIPERPQRPRRASIPSTSFTKEDLQAVTDAMSGIGLQISQEPSVDTRNIGFAVTNGSNPKRRSRSVGAFRASDHRMSPIQWRHLRTKSDDLTCYRGSKEAPEKVETQQQEVDAEANTDLGSQEEGFNFGLQGGDLPGHERIGLEERLVTLEIKLMDLEYALSKLQAGSATYSQRSTKRGRDRPSSIDTYNSFEAPSVSTEAIPQSPSNKYPGNETILLHGNRPTSVATTLKPGQNLQANSFGKPSADVNNRLSLSALTIEHYTTLVTLVRHEQSARMRLEEQVQQLQQNFERSETSNGNPRYNTGSFSGHRRDLSSSSQLSRRFGTINDDGRRRGKYLEPRARSSSYSTNETDTEDDYHDAYVTPTNITPVERGEYERGAFNRIPGVEDGEAF